MEYIQKSVNIHRSYIGAQSNQNEQSYYHSSEFHRDVQKRELIQRQMERRRSAVKLRRYVF
ncbi:MAG: hypothetical protein WAT71_05625 [Ignavibacteria bacterium]